MDKIISLWTTLRALSDDIGVPYTTVASWHQCGMIPARYDTKIVSAAQKNGIALTLADIAEARASAFERRMAS